MPTIYDQFKPLPAWTVVDQAVNDLIENNDVIEQTLHYYVVGYIVKALSEADLLKE
jgi:hypothetical protein